jgi:hypothetical protein
MRRATVRSKCACVEGHPPTKLSRYEVSQVGQAVDLRENDIWWKGVAWVHTDDGRLKVFLPGVVQLYLPMADVRMALNSTGHWFAVVLELRSRRGSFSDGCCLLTFHSVHVAVPNHSSTCTKLPVSKSGLDVQHLNVSLPHAPDPAFIHRERITWSNCRG